MTGPAMTGPDMSRPAVTGPAVTGRSRRAGRGRMSLWRLEWLRLVRTPRAVALGVVFAFIGLVEPVAAKYESTIIRHLGGGAQVAAPTPTPADAVGSYVTEVTFIGLILVVAFAAGAMSFDTRPGLATFLRTRVASIWQLVMPRFTVNAAAAVLAYLLGTLGAWYETRMLIGPLPAGGMLGGMLCGAVYFTFAVAVAAFAASVVRSTIGAIGTALVILILLPIASVIRPVARWLPSALVSAPVSLVNGTEHLAYYWPALAVSGAAGAAALMLAAGQLRRREV
jgi:ABC-2 type transport system permease protein